VETAVNPDLNADHRVDIAAIEKSLADLWRADKDDGEHTVTRAALWNVVAHTTTSALHATASETLARASAAVPQRTIVVRADPAAAPEMSSWISANCHQVGGGKQVCSEEIAIVAGGDRVHRVPPLVNALLLPDMPVAFWWLGDLPNGQDDYVSALLEPADRLIVDSVYFDSPDDLRLVGGVAAQTTTAPADLNWVRLEEWRTATASVFDAVHLRERLDSLRSVRVVAAAGEGAFFGHSVQSLFYTSWLATQLGHDVAEDGAVQGGGGAIDYRFERTQSDDVGGVAHVELTFADGWKATITRDCERSILTTNVDGVVNIPDSVTRNPLQKTPELIVRQLKRPEGDRMLLKVLPLAVRMASRVVA
jgi:glucose-6-phosphate dehydrogenase assembly protein OpcA